MASYNTWSGFSNTQTGGSDSRRSSVPDGWPGQGGSSNSSSRAQSITEDVRTLNSLHYHDTLQFYNFTTTLLFQAFTNHYFAFKPCYFSELGCYGWQCYPGGGKGLVYWEQTMGSEWSGTGFNQPEVMWRNIWIGSDLENK